MKTVRKRLADGTERAYFYHRRTGQPLAGEPGQRAFLESWQKAEFPAPTTVAALDLDWLIERYQASPEWARLSKATRDGRLSYFGRIRRRFAGAVLAYFENPEIVSVLYEWRDELAGQPWTANHGLDAMSRLFSWAKKRRHMAHNWVSEVERFEVETRAEKTWERELWSALLTAAEPDERELLEFAMFSMARQEDIAALPGGALDPQGWLVFKPLKTAKRTKVTVQLPTFALPPLAELLARRSRATEFLLCTSTGHPWTTHNIKLRMRALKRRAFPGGDPDRTFHDIRGTGASRLMDAGCTDAEVASILGWVIGARRSGSGDGIGMTRAYVRRSQQLALNAYQRWYAAEWPSAGNVVPIRAAAAMTTEATTSGNSAAENGGFPRPHLAGIPEGDN